MSATKNHSVEEYKKPVEEMSISTRQRLFRGFFGESITEEQFHSIENYKDAIKEMIRKHMKKHNGRIIHPWIIWQQNNHAEMKKIHEAREILTKLGLRSCRTKEDCFHKVKTIYMASIYQLVFQVENEVDVGNVHIEELQYPRFMKNQINYDKVRFVKAHFYDRYRHNTADNAENYLAGLEAMGVYIPEDWKANPFRYFAQLQFLRLCHADDRVKRRQELLVNDGKKIDLFYKEAFDLVHEGKPEEGFNYLNQNLMPFLGKAMEIQFKNFLKKMKIRVELSGKNTDINDMHINGLPTQMKSHLAFIDNEKSLHVNGEYTIWNTKVFVFTQVNVELDEEKDMFWIVPAEELVADNETGRVSSTLTTEIMTKYMSSVDTLAEVIVRLFDPYSG